MSDFEAALQDRLERNAELAEQRAQAEKEMDRVQAEQRADAERRRMEQADARLTRHTQLVEHLQQVAGQLKERAPESFVVRLGWTESHEEYLAKISTRRLQPARTLFIELDRDDDEVLARWTSDLGNSLELWRLLEVSPDVLTELVLQVADQQLWRQASRPPAFPDV